MLDSERRDPMQLQQLIYFVTVAEQGSINKAAEKLFIT